MRPVPFTERCGPGMAVAIVLLALNLRTFFAALPPLLGDVRDDLGISAGVAGLLTTLPVVCLGALAPVGPRLARRVPVERLLMACALLTAVGNGLHAISSVAALFAAALVAGAAIALAQALLPVLIATRFPSQTGVLTGAFSMSLALGAALAAALAVPVERALDGGWEPALAAWALPALLATLVWIPAALKSGTVVPASSGPSVLRSRVAWMLALFFGLQSMAFYVTLAWAPSVLEDAGYGEGAAGLLLALAGVAQLVPAFGLPQLAVRRRSQVGLLIWTVVVPQLVGTVGLLLAPGDLGALWMVVIGIGQGAALGLGLALPALRGTDAHTIAALTGMMFCVGYLLAATGPWIVGLAFDLTGGWAVPLGLLLAMALAQLAVGMPAARPGEPARAAPG